MQLTPPFPVASRHAWLRKTQLMRLLIALVLSVGVVAPAQAVWFVSFLPVGSPGQLTLRVGAAGAGVSDVVFNVNTPATLTSLTPVTGVVTPLPAGGVEVSVRARTGTIGRPVRLSVTMSPLSCVVGVSACFATVIPANKISWTVNDISSYQDNNQNPPVIYPTLPSGRYTGAAQISNVFWVSSGGGTVSDVEMRAFLVFQYDNDTAYPAGSYTGTAVYSASTP